MAKSSVFFLVAVSSIFSLMWLNVDAVNSMTAGADAESRVASIRAQFVKEVEELKGEVHIGESELEDLKKQEFTPMLETVARVNAKSKTMSEAEAWETIDHRLTEDARALLKPKGETGLIQVAENAPSLGKGTPIEKALRFLNAEYKEVYEKLDVVLFNCGMYKVEKEALVEGINKEITDLAALCGFYVSAIQESQMNIDEQNEILAQLNADLEAHLKSCAQQIAVINGQIAIVRDDLNVVTTIIKAGEEACKKTLFLQKRATSEEDDTVDEDMNEVANFAIKQCRTGGNGKLEVVVENTMITNALAQLNSEKARDTARRMLWEATELSDTSNLKDGGDDGDAMLPDGLEYSKESEEDEDDDDEGDDETAAVGGGDEEGGAFVQISADGVLPPADGKLLDGDDEDDAEDKEPAILKENFEPPAKKEKKQKKAGGKLVAVKRQMSSATSTVTAAPTSPVTKAATKPSAKAQKSMCPLGTKPNCAPLLEKLAGMWAEIKDALDKLEKHLAAVTLECNTIEANYRSDIANAEHLVAQFTAKMTEDTAMLQNAMYEGTQKEVERHEVCSEMRVEYAKCYKDLKALEEELCGVIIIRFATHQKMVPTIKEPDFQDCIVSGWTPGTCSKTCIDAEGIGGIEIFAREVTIQPNKIGAACPPMTWERACGEGICPLDCKLDIWDPWGKCSKECGGGSQARTRHVLQEPTPGGVPCAATQQGRQCNTHSCDVDCVLHDWTAWSPCSKSCIAYRGVQAGSQSRKRHIRVAIKGNGVCAKPRQRVRYGVQKCNNFICPKVLNCIAPQDMVIALDGSGSLWYRSWRRSEWDRNFRRTQHFARSLVEASTMDGWDALDQNDAVDESKPELGVRKPKHVRIAVNLFSTRTKVISPLTGDKKALLKKIDAMKWPMGGTYTHKALKRAKEQLKFSGKSRVKTVVLITDGRATDRRSTFIVARELRRAGIIIKVVPVGRAIKRWEICRVASPPCNQNVEMARKWSVLDNQMNRFIAGSCPKVATGMPKMPEGLE